MTMDWDNPTERYQLIERLGIDGYNAALAARQRQSTLATVNGYAIREINSRFGRLFAVGGTDKAFCTRAEAEAFARGER
jgi:hypothetical protein